jgi:hypothetical protein
MVTCKGGWYVYLWVTPFMYTNHAGRGSMSIANRQRSNKKFYTKRNKRRTYFTNIGNNCIKQFIFLNMDDIYIFFPYSNLTLSLIRRKLPPAFFYDILLIVMLKRRICNKCRAGNVCGRSTAYYVK